MLLIVRNHEGQQIVMAGHLQFFFDPRNFLLIILRAIRFVQNVMLLILHVHASKAILQIFAERAELAVAAVIALEEKVTVVIERRMHALITQLVFETHRVIAAILVPVRLDAEETVFERE